MNRCGSLPLLSEPHSLFSIWADLKRSEKIPGAPAWRWGEWIRLTGPSGLHWISPQGLNISFITAIFLLKSYWKFAPRPEIRKSQSPSPPFYIYIYIHTHTQGVRGICGILLTVPGEDLKYIYITYICGLNFSFLRKCCFFLLFHVVVLISLEIMRKHFYQ